VKMRAGGKDTASAPRFRNSLPVWAKIGLLSFGGPAGQIAMMHRMLVDERQWIGERAYLSALNFCMLLPGPEAMQLATYVGWRMHGVIGGLAAGLLFVLPGAVFMLAVALGYLAFGKTPLAEALFVGVKAAVLAIVIEALLRIARRALKEKADWVIAAAAFVAIFFLAVPFPLIVLGAALAGFLLLDGGSVGRQTAIAIAPTPTPVSATLATALTWLAIWIVPLAILPLVFDAGHVLPKLAWFFSKLAVVTFGGAYAVLAYMAQDVVEGYAWLGPGEMLDALGLAETTPGPLILVNEFVGALAAARHGGGSPYLMAVLGALVALWATFAPCFLWIFVGAPYVERLNEAPRLSAALKGVTAAVVGVILNLTVWFALHVLFRSIDDRTVGPLRLLVPDIGTVDAAALFLAALAMVLIFAGHRGIVSTLLVCAGLSLAWNMAA